MSTLYVERSHVDRADNAVVLINKERTVRVPAAMVAVILLGPGTRITHGAVNLLADSGTAICWVGEHGVRFYASGGAPSRSSHLLVRQAHLVSHPHERIVVARKMYAMRFPGEDVSKLSMQQLRGREGYRVKKLYSENSRRTGVAWERRAYIAGSPDEAGDDVNRVLSAANACLYGLCHAVITGLGASPGLGFVHSGSSISFVLDLADLYKGETSIPLAFTLAANERTEERDVRRAFRDTLRDGKLLQRAISDTRALLLGAAETGKQDASGLWDERSGLVKGGVNWGDEEGLAQGHHVVSGPAFEGNGDE